MEMSCDVTPAIHGFIYSPTVLTDIFPRPTLSKDYQALVPRLVPLWIILVVIMKLILPTKWTLLLTNFLTVTPAQTTTSLFSQMIILYHVHESLQQYY